MSIIFQHKNTFFANDIDDKTLRQQLNGYGIDARRFSRFTQIALLGALPLKPFLTPNTAIYLGSPFNSPSKFDKMFHQLANHDLPSPLDFMANINNAATFQLAQALETTGNSLFLSINQHNYWQPLELAMLDLTTAHTQQALIGWVKENSQGEEKMEGACFWVVGKA